MKKYIGHIAGALTIVLVIFILTLLFPQEFTLQYLEDGELKTESFKRIEDYNNRTIELQADGIKYWLD